MRAVLFVVLTSVSGVALANDLAEANAAYAARDYPTALALYQNLAAHGNLPAQVRLGEMIWYGEGTVADRARADSLFAAAAAAGDAQAALDLQLSGRRADKAAAIAYWTTTYQGEDLISGKYACPAPDLPITHAMNRTQIEQVGKRFAAWRDCYAGFFTNLGDAMPAGKRIPADVSAVMSEAEFQQARDHLSEVYARVLKQKKDDSRPTVAELDNWIMRTTKFNVDRQYVSNEQQHWMKDYYQGVGVVSSVRIRK